MTHICVSKLTKIGSDTGLSPDRRHAIIWTNTGILLIGPLETNISEILIEICIFFQENAFENVVRKLAASLSPPQCVNCFAVAPNVHIWLWNVVSKPAWLFYESAKLFNVKTKLFSGRLRAHQTVIPTCWACIGWKTPLLPLKCYVNKSPPPHTARHLVATNKVPHSLSNVMACRKRAGKKNHLSAMMSSITEPMTNNLVSNEREHLDYMSVLGNNVVLCHWRQCFDDSFFPWGRTKGMVLGQKEPPLNKGTNDWNISMITGISLLSQAMI